MQMTKYGLYDVIRIKKKESMLILQSFTSSDINFKTFFMPKVILAKILSQKKLLLSYILNLSAL